MDRFTTLHKTLPRGEWTMAGGGWSVAPGSGQWSPAGWGGAMALIHISQGIITAGGRGN